MAHNSVEKSDTCIDNYFNVIHSNITLSVDTMSVSKMRNIQHPFDALPAVDDVAPADDKKHYKLLCTPPH